MNISERCIFIAFACNMQFLKMKTNIFLSSHENILAYLVLCIYNMNPLSAGVPG